MVIRGSGPDLGNEFKTHSDFLVFLIQIISIILTIRVSAFSHPPSPPRYRFARHEPHAATACAGTRYSSCLVNLAQMARANLLASAMAASLLGLLACLRAIGRTSCRERVRQTV